MKVLNIGSLNIDKVYQVPHFVSAGETLSSTDLQIFPGGKGLNQSIAAAKAGLSICHAGKIGPDGAFLSQLLSDSGVDTHLIRTVPGAATGHAVIQIDPSGQNCILLFGGTNEQITTEDIEHFLEPFGPGDVLLLQNEISHPGEAARLAVERGLRVVLNPSPISPRLQEIDLDLISLFLLNEVEGAALSGGQTEPEAILETLCSRYPRAEVVLTLGGQGSLYRGKEQSVACPAFPVGAVDTTAAGDTFTGYFLSAWLEGKTPEEGLLFASAAAGIAVSRPGAAPSIPEREEVLRFLARHGRPQP